MDGALRHGTNAGAIARFVRAMVGPDADIDSIRHARVLLVYSLTLLGVSIGWGGMHIAAGASELGLLFLLCAAFVLGSLVDLWRNHVPKRTSHMLLVTALLTTCLATGLSGGLRATNVCPFLILMVAAVFLLGRSGLAWAAASLIAALGFQIAEWCGVDFPDTVPSADLPLDQFLTWFSTAIVVFFFSWAHESSRAVNVRQLRDANRALQESEGKYRMVVSHASDAIVLVQDDRIVFYNERAVEWSGCSEQELAGREYLKFVYGPDRDTAEREVNTPSERPKALRGRLIDKFGRLLYVEATSVLVAWGGRPASLFFIKDVSERRKTEEALRRAAESIRHAQRMEAVGRLAGGVAHDFNNYLTTIVGAAVSLEEKLPRDHSGTEIEDIRHAADLASTLTHQLLAFGRKQLLNPVVVDLNNVVADLGSVLQRMVGEDIEVATVLRPGLGRVRLDPGQIEQVITNLAVNARDSMPHGGRLSIGAENVTITERPMDREGRTGDFVCLTVTDTGVGMDRETAEHVFEPFFTTKPSGSGLGLAVVYGIVTQHEGWVSVDSVVGSGTTFRVYLPACDAPETPAVSGSKVDPPDGNQRRVLIVEDMAPIRRYTAGVLRKHGYLVFEADCAEEALRQYEAEGGQVDLLLADVMLEGMSGVSLAKALMARDPKLRVLLSSGYVESDLDRLGVETSLMPFIHKPYDPNRLLASVHDALAPNDGGKIAFGRAYQDERTSSAKIIDPT